MIGTEVRVVGANDLGEFDVPGVVIEEAPYCLCIKYTQPGRMSEQAGWFNRESGKANADNHGPPWRFRFVSEEAG